MSQLFYSKLFENSSEGHCASEVSGVLPDWFTDKETTIIYNGPVGKWDWPGQTVRHWFDGMAFLTKFHISNNKKGRSTTTVELTKRFLKSEAFEKAEANGKLIVTEYATVGAPDPQKNFLSRMASSIVPGELTDNCACNIFEFGPGGPLVAATETSLLRRVDQDTLETLDDKIDMSSLVNVASARPLMDCKTGDVYNLSASFLTGLKYHFIKFPRADLETSAPKLVSSGKIVATVHSRMKTCFSYYHTFGMTDQFLVMVEQPLVANAMKLVTSTIKGLTFKECLEWYPDYKNQFHIIDKTTGQELTKFKYVSSEPFFFMNVVNAFWQSASNCLVLDLVAYESPELLDKMFIEQLRQESFQLKSKSRLVRCSLPLESSDVTVITVQPEQLCSEVGFEHPIVNNKYRGLQHRYVYVIGWLESVNRGHFANALTKIDLQTGDTIAWRGCEFCHPSEPVFIPNPDPGASEDDGLIVASVTDVRTDQQDFLLFVEAKNMTEVARASMQEKVPFSSHAFWTQKVSGLL